MISRIMDEKELLRQIRSGDTAAFNELVILYQPKIVQHCLSIVKDYESAQDLSQEAFLRAFSKLNTFEGNASFYTWVFRIAHNLSLNYLKKVQKTHLREFREEIFIPSTDVSSKKQATEEVFVEAMKKLDQKQRVVFEMYEIEKRPQKEIAHLLNIPLGTVRSRLHYARRKMRAIVSELLK